MDRRKEMPMAQEAETGGEERGKANNGCVEIVTLVV